MATKDAKGSIGIIGSGLIGQSWAMIFVASEYRVRIYDISSELVEKALKSIEQQLINHEKAGSLRGSGSAQQQMSLITPCTDIKDCVTGALYVQECVPEILSLKQKVFEDLDNVADQETILASSSSAIPSSKFTEKLKTRHRCLIAHPVNPPYFMPLVELVPAPWTDPDVVRRARDLIEFIGQSPVTLKKEVPAFVQPRIQYAIIAECLNLVSEGVLDVDDVDKLLKEGLGNEYSFIGPFLSLHLSNDKGLAGLLEEQGGLIQKIADTLEVPPPLDPHSTLINSIDSQLSSIDPPGEGLISRRRWRDERLSQLAMIKRRFNDMDKSQ